MNMDKIIELIAIAEASGNFEKSFRLHMEAAERGNVVAMSEVGSMYMRSLECMNSASARNKIFTRL